MKNIFILIVVLLLSLCNNCTFRNNTFRDREKEYSIFKSDVSEKVKNQIPSFFPQKGDRLIAHFPDGINAIYFCDLIVINDDTLNFTDKFDSIKGKGLLLTNNIIIKFIPKDKFNWNLLETNDLVNKKDSVEKDFITFIPNDTILLSEYFADKNGRLDYYLFNAEEGIFLSDKYDDYYSSMKYYQHGYSCGAIVDVLQKKIAYWFLVW